MEIQSENSILIGKKLDLVSDKLGLNLPPVTLELKDALAKLQADNDKKHELVSAQVGEILKVLAKMGLGAAGVPPAITNAGFGLLETALGGTAIATVTKIGTSILADRRRKKDDEEWEEHCKELEEKHKEEKERQERLIKEEAEREKERIRLKLEQEKEEIRIKGLIKAETMAYVKEESQEEFIKAKERAIKNLKARGEI